MQYYNDLDKIHRVLHEIRDALVSINEKTRSSDYEIQEEMKKFMEGFAYKAPKEKK